MKYLAAIDDVISGARQYQFWVTFGSNDIKAKYRRSKLGQLWITLSVAIFIFVIGGLYRGIFSDDSGTYMAYLAVGYICWLFMQSAVNTGCMAIIQAKPILMQKSWPISTFIYRLVYREILILAHHSVLLPPIFIWLGLWPGLSGILLSLLGLLLLIVTGFWVAMLMAIISLRFRDFPPTVQAITRVAFLATPIIWIDRNLGKFGEWVVLLNPFGYFIRIVRDPLLGSGLLSEVWLIALGISFVTMMITIIAAALTKRHLAYWL